MTALSIEQLPPVSGQEIRISVITVCKNAEAHIEKAIQSVVSQTYKNIEYIIVDGDSQDKTKEIIQKYSKHITKFISEPDTGIYNAMNKGIKLATGSFIQFLNSDDYFYDKNVIEDVVQFTQQNPDCDIVYGDAEIRPDPRIGGEPFIAKSPLPSDIPESLIVGHFFLQGSIFFSSNSFEKLGYFNETYQIAGDYEFYLRLIDKNAKKMNAIYFPNVIFSYFSGGISSNLRDNFGEMFYIQNQSCFFKSEAWNNKRIAKYQQSIIDLKLSLYGVLEALEMQKMFIDKLNNPLYALKVFVKSILFTIFQIRTEKINKKN